MAESECLSTGTSINPFAKFELLASLELLPTLSQLCAVQAQVAEAFSSAAERLHGAFV
jgi:hypothetical protein